MATLAAAVAPLDKVEPLDVAMTVDPFVRWLGRASGGALGLRSLSGIAAPLPLACNAIALSDALFQFSWMAGATGEAEAIRVEDWAELSIHLIGLIPAADEARTACMLLRAMLQLARQAPRLDESLLDTLTTHLHSTVAGELDSFAGHALQRLPDLLEAAAEVADGLIDDLLRTASAPESLQRGAAPAKALHDSRRKADWPSLLASLAGLHDELPSSLRSDEGDDGLVLPDWRRGLAAVKPGLRVQLGALAAPEEPAGIARQLIRIRDAAVGRVRERTVIVPADRGLRVVEERPGHALETTSRQAPARREPSPCTRDPAPMGGGGTIGFATGCETLVQLDAVLQAPLPIAWERRYRSQLDADDAGLGARWLHPYAARIDAVIDRGRQRLAYRGADGRSHRYPWLDPGARHHDAAEQRTLSCLGSDLIAVDAGRLRPPDRPGPWRELFQRVEDVEPPQWRLGAVQAGDGLLIGLRHDHRLPDGRSALSDVISRRGEEILAHLRTQVDDAGRIVELWEVRGGAPVRQLAAYRYDEHGDLVQAMDENAAVRHYAYGRDGAASDHLLVRRTDRTGRATHLAYDGHGPDAKAIREWPDDGSPGMRLAWDRHIRRVTLTDALGAATDIYYEIGGRPYRIVYADGRQEWFHRDGGDRLLRHLHPDGSSDQHVYDAEGQLIRHTGPDGSRLHFEYDRAHRLSGMLDREGHAWRREYDPQGRLEETIDPLGHRTRYGYDRQGRPAEVIDAKGGRSTTSHTALGQLESYTDCSGRTTRYTHDERGRLSQATDAAGRSVGYRYTRVDANAAARHAAGEGGAPGLLEAIVLPDGSEERWEHDAEGRVLSYTDALQSRTSYRHDAVGRVVERIDPLGHRLRCRWDALDRLVELRNENDQPWRFHYDEVGRLLQQTTFDGRVVDYAYAPSTGRLVERREGGVVWRVRLDAAGRLVERSAALPGEAALTETFAYDANGRLAMASNRDAVLQWFYDAAGRLVREQQRYRGPLIAEERTTTWQHAYDELGHRVETLRPSGLHLQWLTYGSGHVHGLLLDGEEVVAFERDALHREVKRTQCNGLEQFQRYDAMGRVAEQRLQPVGYSGPTGMGTGLFEYVPGGAPRGGPAAVLRTYRYDAVGRLLCLADSRRGQIDYGYDARGRLVRADSALAQERFAYDPAGNRSPGDPADLVPRASPVVPDNRVSAYGEVRYRYDERGNVVERAEGGRVMRLEWDALGRLRRAVTSEGATEYAYDPLGRRIAKAAVGSPAAGQSRLFEWDGWVLSGECESAACDTVDYVYEPASHVPLARCAGIFRDRAERLAFFQCDMVGVPSELTGPHSSTVWSALRGALGNVLIDDGKVSMSPMGFQGQYNDIETGLHYNAHRFYDHTTGRFLQVDPLGLYGSINPYEHVRGNPVGRIDPRGTMDVFVGGAMDGFSEIVKNFSKAYRKKNPATTTVYCEWDQSEAIIATIRGAKLINPCEAIRLVGHSWGGSTAAAVSQELKASGIDVDVLITIDPVSREFSKVPGAARRWINVNAIPQESNGFGGDRWAEWGGKWGDWPKGQADSHFDAPSHHNEFESLINFIPAGGRSALQILQSSSTSTCDGPRT